MTMAERKKKQTAVSDEEIIAALLNSGSISEAAKLTGIAPRTIYDRMGYREFKAAYSAAKADIMRQAVLTMTRKLSEAVEVITGIMTNEENAPGIRLQAAKMIIENAARFTDRINDADQYTAAQAASPLELDPAKW